VLSFFIVLPEFLLSCCNNFSFISDRLLKAEWVKFNLAGSAVKANFAALLLKPVIKNYFRKIGSRHTI